MAGRATVTAVLSRKAMPDASTVAMSTHRPRVVPSATGGSGRVPVTGASAGYGMGEEVGERGHGPGGRQRHDPGDHDAPRDAHRTADSRRVAPTPMIDVVV